MSYQVLARKWRPNRFGELVGQEHVVSAISNALDNNRLHHAYLFTGTRGVGKTTIARIFSKSLNCEQGLSAMPCGQCSTCKEIENGNFIDLLEIDAASRTKVEDTRELLDNVQYKPSRGRYKVYLIDEVHMLSKHSFNALLKTLEEPPPHVKFLLATTDPQKLPVTILSRCLQFNLKALSRSQIAQQLEHVLSQESIAFDKEPLGQLARAAQGSMRDALSLTDQAIAQGNGSISLQIVTDMLGLMDKNQVLKLVHAVIQKDSAQVMQQVDFMAEQAPDFALILAEIMSLLHQVALTQFVPDACKLETISARAIYQLAKSVPSEQIQLLYQIALTGKKDLPHAVDARTGLEMTLLRMLAFSPDNASLPPEDIAQHLSQVIHSETQPQAMASEQDEASSSPSQNIKQEQQDSEQQVKDDEAQSIAPANEEHNQPDLGNNDTQQVAQQGDTKITPSAEPADSQIEADTQIEPEQDLNAQQQDILSQAQEYGHQTFDYNELEPVTLEDTQQGFDPSKYQLDAMQQTSGQSEQANSAPVQPTSTAELIAIRNQLKQRQASEEEDSHSVKKSESAKPLDLAAIRAKQSETAVESPADTQEATTPQPDTEQAINLPSAKADAFKTTNQIKTDEAASHALATPSKNAVQDLATNESQKNTSSKEIEQAPPWSVDNAMQAEVQPVPSPFKGSKELEQAEAFDPNAHLDEDDVGEVTLTIPAFLDDKQKVVKAMQVDSWSKLIEDMQLTALTKQLALHSAFDQHENKVKLTLLEKKSHLISDTAKQQLQDALSRELNLSVELELELGQPINTPYALQMRVNQVRKDYAIEVIQSDPGIQLLQQQFAAKIDQQSIHAR